MDSLLSGAAFGAALTASGIYEPATLLSQFDFTNFHMLQTFLTAAAGSTLLVTATQSLSLTNFPPRRASSLGLFSVYDGNLVGGSLLGTGMALSGACPGTILAQLGVGVRSGWYVFGGAVLAGWVWSLVSSRRRPKSDMTLQQQQQQQQQRRREEEKVTVYEALGVSRLVAAAAFEATCVLAVAAVSRAATGPQAKIHPAAGGLFIAAAQAVSLLLRGALVGTSSSYEDVGRLLRGDRPKGLGSILFSAGAVGGAWLLSRAMPALGQVSEVAISPAMAGLGGFLMVLGSRMAGGCTSGHGISGISLLSMSSFMTITAAFAAAGVMGLLLG
ncbi:hypothetical protein MMYC01_203595 [Madurella mycetomatis]|uniref:Uncharacterized protein n=1 Tax=Madurella mycetomatis TaxID=100816 RepID=A0A175W939_9PEZI|nr:hypothetical protein MMYC01_203595 [Madurella mycetomatis]